MKRIFAIFSSAVVLFASCEEFQPVFTGEYDDPSHYETTVIEPTHTIAELAAMYKIEKPFVMDQNIIIEGVISTTDQPGNFYKSFYIQDETGGMEIKVGKNGLYNDYKQGQTVYIICNGLSLGMYGYKDGNYGGYGMVQIGCEDTTGEYETSYIEVPVLIDNHIKRGAIGDPVEPIVIEDASGLPSSTSTLAKCPYLGKLVTLKGLKYENETFVLLYLDSNKDKDSYTNRVFLSETNGVVGGDLTHGITTWAMSETLMKDYLYSGIWDTAQVGSGNNFLTDANGDVVTLGSLRGNGNYPFVEKAAYAVSQYFSMDGKEIQVRTSGYSKFSDTQIDPDVLAGKKTVDITGVLTLYQGSIQLVMNNISDVKINN